MKTDQPLSIDKYLPAIVAYLEEQGAVTRVDLEDFIWKQFKSDMTKTHLANQTGRNRTRWENLVDHCKAWLTRRGLIVYCRNSVVYVPDDGQLLGTAIVRREAAMKALYKLAGLL